MISISVQVIKIYQPNWHDPPEDIFSITFSVKIYRIMFFERFWLYLLFMYAMKYMNCIMNSNILLSALDSVCRSFTSGIKIILLLSSRFDTSVETRVWIQECASHVRRYSNDTKEAWYASNYNMHISKMTEW